MDSTKSEKLKKKWGWGTFTIDLKGRSVWQYTTHKKKIYQSNMNIGMT